LSPRVSSNNMPNLTAMAVRARQGVDSREDAGLQPMVKVHGVMLRRNDWRSNWPTDERWLRVN
jgi:hypothetical protein